MSLTGTALNLGYGIGALADISLETSNIHKLYRRGVRECGRLMNLAENFLERQLESFLLQEVCIG